MAECGEGIAMVSELERLAMRGEPMPEGLSLTDQRFFQSLSLLYARYRAGFIDRAAGSREKGQILYQRDLEGRQREMDDKLIRHHVELTRAIEGAQNAYRKERTLENADRLSAALDGRL